MMQDHILADLSITLYGHRTLLFVYDRMINLCLDTMLTASGALVLTCSQCAHTVQDVVLVPGGQRSRDWPEHMCVVQSTVHCVK